MSFFCEWPLFSSNSLLSQVMRWGCEKKSINANQCKCTWLISVLCSVLIVSILFLWFLFETSFPFYYPPLHSLLLFIHNVFSRFSFFSFLFLMLYQRKSHLCKKLCLVGEPLCVLCCCRQEITQRLSWMHTILEAVVHATPEPGWEENVQLCPVLSDSGEVK